jgi:hypothetical protein
MVSLFASTLFLTSALLFAVEPLIAKELLPVLGGGAVVWTTAVAFFQLALFVGYLYAHLAPAALGVRRHAWLHVALLAGVVLAFPLRSPDHWVAPNQHQALWLLGRLALSIGPTFVVLAATTPLVHRWFAATLHRDAGDPYFLYAASNTGSLVALVAYPLLLEPLLGLRRQREGWTGASWVAVAMLAVCAAMVKRHASTNAALGEVESRSGALPPGRSSPPATSSPRPSWPQRLHWLALAAVPSSLLLSVTSYMTTDLMALPLLWVMPLALYLLAFIFAFAPRAPLSSRRMVLVQGLVLVPLIVQLSLRTASVGWSVLPAHAFLFFVTALVCHQALARGRPAADRATEFYLWVAAGGALGGLFNVLVAPQLFTSLVEYPLGLVLAALLRPAPDGPGDSDDTSNLKETGARARRRSQALDLLSPAALCALLVVGVGAAHVIETRVGGTKGLIALGAVLAAAGVVGYSFRSRPRRFGLGLAAILVGGGTYSNGATQLVYAERSFYGVLRVNLEPPTTRTLAHGHTLHGAQDLAPARRREPLAYYSREGPVGDLMAAWRGRAQRRRVGIVGLGAGTLAAYADPGERWTFFEIDPGVQDIAREAFTFLRDARAPVDVVLGDARLSLAAVADGTFGFLVLDAFSSDAVPAHLLTREAMALYLRKLSPGGVLAVHISNRFLDLEPVVAGSATAAGLSGLSRFDRVTEDRARGFEMSSDWMVLARSPADLAPLAGDKRWVAPRQTGKGWTDDASDLWGALRLGGS